MPPESSRPTAEEPAELTSSSDVRVAGRCAGAAVRTLRTGRDLVAAGLIAVDAADLVDRIGASYSIAVPPVFAALIDPSDPNDPIARQVLPDPRERAMSPGERLDPIGDAAHSPVKGITHRYPDRVLLKPVLSCPLYCRFCFRREVVGRAGGSLAPGELDAALAYIEQQQAVREVILTGGDPLLLAPRRLHALLQRLARVDHVETLRIHSRVPVAVPERVDAALVAALRSGIAVWLSVHVNHPRELGEAAVAALTRLADAGVPLLAQTVLLRGVNDDPEVLATLFRQLVRLRVKPYYLHHPDPAPGTAHFRLGLAEGQRIFQTLRGRLSGHALPTYVLDVPGGAGKVPVDAPWVRALADGSHEIRDPNGGTHRYP